MRDVTIVYYTAHQEEPQFEERIRERLVWASGGLSIVSVSQQPLSCFGRNICVGVHPPCMWNLRRQMLIGAEQAETEWVVFTEADTLYPPEFFEMALPADPARFIRYSPGAIVYRHKVRAWPKYAFETGILIHRGLALGWLTADLQHGPEWGTAANEVGYIFRKDRADVHTGQWPIVSFKTGRSLHKHSHSDKRHHVRTLPGWGNVEALKDNLFVNVEQPCTI